MDRHTKNLISLCTFPPPARRAGGGKAACVLSIISLLLFTHLPALAAESPGQTPQPNSGVPSHAPPVYDLIKLARRHNPLLKAKAAAAGQMEEAWLAQSWLADNPQIAVSYRNIPVGQWPALGKHPMSGVDITVSQKFSAPWEYHYRNKLFKSKFLSRKQKALLFERELVRDITILYHELGFIKTQIRILKENKRSLLDIVQIARGLVRVNKMNSSQLLKVEADAAIVDNRILSALAQLEQSHNELNTLCGVSVPDKMLPGENWEEESETPESNKLPVTFNPENHPLYLVYEKEALAAGAVENHERAKLFPGVTLSGGYTFREEITGRDAGEDFISLKVTAPLPLYYGFKDRHNINSGEKLAVQKRNELKNTRNMLNGKWRGQQANAEKALEAYTTYKQQVLPKYRASYKAQLGALASGSVSLLDVLDSYRRYLSIAIEKAAQYKRLKQSSAVLVYLSTPNQKTPTTGQPEEQK